MFVWKGASFDVFIAADILFTLLLFYDEGQLGKLKMKVVAQVLA